MNPSRPARVGVFVDDVLHVDGAGRVSTNRAFWRFAAEVGRRFDGWTAFGRAVSTSEHSDHDLGDVRLAALPHYESLHRPGEVVAALPATVRRLWRALDDVDLVWAFGPNPVAIILVVLARLRGRAVVLGVRESTVAYARARFEHRRGASIGVAAAIVLDAVYRTLARGLPVTVVGPDIAARYRWAPKVHEMVVSLVPAATVPDEAHAPAADGELRLLTVGRIDVEKDPELLLAALADLRNRGARFRFTWVGRGPLEPLVRNTLESAGLSDVVVLRGYVADPDELGSCYRDADVFLHVSRTEGVPQVLVEAMAAGTAVIATDVGGVPALVEDGRTGLLIPVGDKNALVAAIERIAASPDLARTLATAGLDVARAHSLESESSKAADFLAAALVARADRAHLRSRRGSTT